MGKTDYELLPLISPLKTENIPRSSTVLFSLNDELVATELTEKSSNNISSTISSHSLTSLTFRDYRRTMMTVVFMILITIFGIFCLIGFLWWQHVNDQSGMEEGQEDELPAWKKKVFPFMQI